MKASLLVLIFTLSTSAFAERVLVDQSGEVCQDKAARVAKQYFEVADTSKKIDFVVSKEDKITALSFKNTTPGSYDQEFVSVLKVKIDRSSGNLYLPEKDQKIKIKFTGDYDCDNLKVKDLKGLGGVERVD
ncbi:MAG: hypothetical protein ACXVLQ_01985 [Bacteriovorax sp.]